MESSRNVIGTKSFFLGNSPEITRKVEKRTIVLEEEENSVSQTKDQLDQTLSAIFYGPLNRRIPQNLWEWTESDSQARNIIIEESFVLHIPSPSAILDLQIDSDGKFNCPEEFKPKVQYKTADKQMVLIPKSNTVLKSDLFYQAIELYKKPVAERVRLRDEKYLHIARKVAKFGLKQGGIPIGSILVGPFESEKGSKFSCFECLLGFGFNKRVQSNSVILHAEMSCLEDAGRQTAQKYRNCTIYTTLSPCPMCSGAIVLYGIKRVVVGENQNFKGAEEYLKSNGVEVVILQDKECIEMMAKFITANPELWNEDIGE